jgi:hypothetical protein
MNFAATLRGDLRFSGHMIDSFGEATIEGVVEYPRVRFKKTYAKPAPDTKSGMVLGIFFYDGKFTDEDRLSGEWFISHRRKNMLRGNWSMERSTTPGAELES